LVPFQTQAPWKQQLVCRNLLPLNGLSLKTSKHTQSGYKTWHDGWNISFGKLLRKLLLQIAHQLKFAKANKLAKQPLKPQRGKAW